MPKFKLFKDRKGKADQARNNKFVKLAREIYMHARRGGPYPEANLALKNAIANARAEQMPIENIERAIKRATATAGGEDYEEIIYEGYGPGGVAIMVKCLTDNRNRTAADVRAIFNKRGGNMGESGCVSYLFDEKGLLVVSREAHDIDEDSMLMAAIDAGAEDIIVNEDLYEILTAPADFIKVKQALEGSGLTFESAGIRWLPRTTVKVEGENAEKLLKMMDAFDDNDDVHDVFANYEIDDEELAKLGG
ncbi:DNA-binding regulatory protein, YebC/PmpR family [Thermobacillus composti KWC4]|uniref:Probable transcriptional regulatory protein Theco_1418 n=1 Tax=Thermobacillus composti (strain DSM 18247 / JCM 13945 / KWC4) TaxID=717605 RepID=L0EBC9_THECK|nr:YebC/PmpR family DNA-binding transcriptional regulator [Thermobacillus composti]AGA57573.1 DNA-binding regulatory protein, YebC/PmpR family [Thermobacillus composti KWC4]